MRRGDFRQIEASYARALLPAAFEDTKALLAAPKHARAIIGNIFLLGAAVVCALQFFAPDMAARLQGWLKLGESSPSVSAIAVSIAVVYLLLLANYEQYADVEKDRDTMRDEIVSLKAAVADRTLRRASRDMIGILLITGINLQNAKPGTFGDRDAWIKSCSDWVEACKKQITMDFGSGEAIRILSHREDYREYTGDSGLNLVINKNAWLITALRQLLGKLPLS